MLRTVGYIPVDVSGKLRQYCPSSCVKGTDYLTFPIPRHFWVWDDLHDRGRIYHISQTEFVLLKDVKALAIFGKC